MPSEIMPSTPSVLRLSNELVTAITKLIHPSTIVNFALTCHRLHDCASSALTIHRSRLQQLRAHHDRHPTNIIDLLRMAHKSPHLLWYVRVLEFYGARLSWEDWTTYSDYENIQNEPQVDFTSTGPGVLLDLDPEVVAQKNGLKSFTLEDMVRILNGDDQPLKMILMASCPCLEKVTWVAQDADPENQPFSLLCDVISMHQSIAPAQWPPGLQSLRSISLGDDIEHVHPHDNLHPEVKDFCHLLLLPNLKKLRINVAGYGEQDLNYLRTHVPARSSSVEEIHFSVCDFDKPTILAILERLKCLKSYRDFYLGDWESILEEIRPWFSDSLEDLRLDGDNDFKLWLYDDLSILSSFTKLRRFIIYVGDLIVGKNQTMLPGIGKGRKIEWHDFDAVLPVAAEDVTFRWPPREWNEQLEKHQLQKNLFPGFFEHLDNFVRQRGGKTGGRLKKIFLDFVEENVQEGDTRQEDAEEGRPGESETAELRLMAEEWRKVWSELGLEVVMRRPEPRNDEDKLECYPVALEEGQESEQESD